MESSKRKPEFPLRLCLRMCMQEGCMRAEVCCRSVLTCRASVDKAYPQRVLQNKRLLICVNITDKLNHEVT